MELTRDALLMKFGSAQSKAPAAWRLIDTQLAETGATFSYQLNREKLKKIRLEQVGRQLQSKVWKYLI